MAVMLLIAAGFARLGVWQLSPAQGAPRGERADRAARAAAPLRITATSAGTDTLAGHRIMARGTVRPGA